MDGAPAGAQGIGRKGATLLRPCRGAGLCGAQIRWFRSFLAPPPRRRKGQVAVGGRASRLISGCPSGTLNRYLARRKIFRSNPAAPHRALRSFRNGPVLAEGNCCQPPAARSAFHTGTKATKNHLVL